MNQDITHAERVALYGYCPCETDRDRWYVDCPETATEYAVTFYYTVTVRVTDADDAEGRAAAYLDSLVREGYNVVRDMAATVEETGVTA